MKSVIIFISIMIHSAVFADALLLKQPAANAFVQSMVKTDQFSAQQVQSALKLAKYQQNIIDAMNHPYEQKTWDVYKSLFLTDERIRDGMIFWQKNQKELQDAEMRYGVPASMIVAIIGIETRYGRQQGNYRVLDALTTLAFYYPKRAEYFERELREYLLLCRENKVAVTQYVGSYAGAIGKPQFMPSSYRQYALSALGGASRANLITNDSDVVMSVANYFSAHGWHKHAKVAEPIIPTHWAIQHLIKNAKYPNYTLKQLRRYGIKLAHGKQHARVGVLEFVNNYKPMEYWLAYPNFYVITRYNSSPQYAMVAYLLSQKLQQQWVLMHAKRHTGV